jgi:hypothetical protein
VSKDSEDKGTLAINDHYDKVRLSWWFQEEGDFGANVGDHPGRLHEDGAAEPSREVREDWECWIADSIAGKSGAERDSDGFYWETASAARKVLKQIKLASKVEATMPEWALKALDAGWKPPKGWKP